MNTILEVANLNHSYSGGMQAGLKNISFMTQVGECLGIVGESGSGKTTLAKLVCQLLPITSGKIYFHNHLLSYYSKRSFYNKVQYISQHPHSSFHPKRTLLNSLSEVCENFRILDNSEHYSFILKTILKTGLKEHHLHQYPYQLSGGECQRAAIARALLVSPELLICDEVTSALDVTIQYEMMLLLKNLKQNNNLSLIFISHDIALVSEFCDTILVLKNGLIREYGPIDEVIKTPKDEYTQLLLSQYGDG